MKRTFKIVTAFFLSMLVICLSVGCAQNKVVYKDAEYTATATIIVTNGAVQEQNGDKIFGSDISASLYLTYTVVDILKTSANYQKVAEELNADGKNTYSYQDLMDRSTIERRSDDTLFIDITFSSTDSAEAILLANTFADVSCRHIPNVLPNAKASIVAVAKD